MLKHGAKITLFPSRGKTCEARLQQLPWERPSLITYGINCAKATPCLKAKVSHYEDSTKEYVIIL